MGRSGRADGAGRGCRHPRGWQNPLGAPPSGQAVSHSVKAVRNQHSLVVSLSNHEHLARPSTLRRAQGRPEHGRGTTGSGRAARWLAVGLALFYACASPPSPPQPTVVWRKLGSWSGHGSTQTDPFISDTGSLRLHWETRDETAPGTGFFRVML